MLVLVALVALAMGWVHRAHDQEQSVARMQQSNPGVVLLYDYEVGPDGSLHQGADPPGPEWLHQRVGVDYFSSVVGADLFYPTDADIACLARFPNLRRLFLARSIDLTDKGLAELATLKQLKLLVLGEADQVTDAGLAHLAALQNLAVMRLDLGRRMTPAGVEQLRCSLPNCRIELRDPHEALAARSPLQAELAAGRPAADAAL